MAKPDYPGLVLVPPSDRSLLKRRLAKWAFLILSVIGGLSALNIWLPSSDRTLDCQVGADAGSSSALRKDCNQIAHTAAEYPKTELLVSQRATTDASERIIPAKSRAAMPVLATPSPKRPIDQSPAQHKAGQTTPTTTPAPANAGSSSSSSLVATAQEEESTANLISPPPGTSHTPAQTNPDVLLAEQGDAFAQYRLGRFYAQQSGLDSPESVSWYMKASDGLRRLASAGDGKAMYVLGVMYAFGRGVVQNREEARSWLAQAVAHQVPAAGPVLASLDKYRSADPGPPNTVQAKRPQT
jgi:TPR repeat protein